MSDEIDRFVLSYKVETGSSVKDIQKLTDAMDKAEKKGASSQGGFTKFSKNLQATKAEIEGVGSSLGNLVASFGRVAPGVAGAGAALLSITAAMKLASNAAKELNAQTALGQTVGMSGMGVENMQRMLSAGSNGRVGPAAAQGMMSRFGGMVRSSFADPMQNNREARVLRAMGVSINGPHGPIDAGTAMEQAGSKLASMRKDEAMALGQIAGLTQTETQALINLGTAQAQNARLSEGQARAYIEAGKQAQELEGHMGSIKESMREASSAIGLTLIPALNDLMDWVDKAAKKVSTGLQSGVEEANVIKTLPKEYQSALLNAANKKDRGISEYENLDAAGIDLLYRAKTELASRMGDANKPASKETVSKLDDVAKTQAQYFGTSGVMERAINLFASSVGTFSDTVSPERALAAWAGLVGAGAGLGSGGAAFQTGGGSSSFNAGAYNAATGIGSGGGSASGQTRGVRNNNPGNIEYGDFAKKAGAIGSDGRFAIFPNMQVGESAMADLQKGYASRGLDTITKVIKKWAPPNENNTAAYIASVARQTGIDPNQQLTTKDQWDKVRRAMMVHESGYRGGPVQGSAAAALTSGGAMLSPSQVDAYNPNAAPTYDFKSGGNPNTGQGQSPRTLRSMAVAKTLAGYIGSGMTVDQLLQGGANKGDVKWAASQARTDLTNKIKQNEIALGGTGITDMQRRALITENGNYRMQLNALNEGAGYLIENSREGGREITLGQNRAQVAMSGDINIHINGAQDPNAIAHEVDASLKSTFGDIKNSHSGALRN
ncbi:TPA: hypothetical protein U2T46_002992 [Burkholderia cenocepacia]|nr:hypothetical protein [Burkholderia cenocepacia]